MSVNFNLAQIITIVSVFLVIIGWFVNQWLNRKNDIAKELRSYRLDMFHSFMDLFYNIQIDVKSTLIDKSIWIRLSKIKTKFYSYGNKYEINAFDIFLETLKKADNLEEIVNFANALKDIVVDGIHKEVHKKNILAKKNIFINISEGKTLYGNIIPRSSLIINGNLGRRVNESEYINSINKMLNEYPNVENLFNAK